MGARVHSRATGMRLSQVRGGAVPAEDHPGVGSVGETVTVGQVTAAPERSMRASAVSGGGVAALGGGDVDRVCHAH